MLVKTFKSVLNKEKLLKELIDALTQYSYSCI